MSKNPYSPWLATISGITQEAVGERPIKTFKLVLEDEEIRNNFSFIPGQCIMVSLFGTGECFFAISSSPTQKEYLEVSVLKLGKVTTELHQFEPGDTVGLRGPYGNHFDVKGWEGKNILFILSTSSSLYVTRISIRPIVVEVSAAAIASTIS